MPNTGNSINPDAPLNGELTRPARVATAGMNWTASPSGSVLRKRVHRVGPAESGQVTSVVQYQAKSQFPRHEHPEGEEILVLDGVFSDEHGDWPAGSYLLNPEGFAHSPFSREGCVLFVKLRQYPGTERQQLQVQTDNLSWEPTPFAGRAQKPLYHQSGFADRMRLERWQSLASDLAMNWQDGVEIFVIAGHFDDENDSYAPGSWLRLPPGSQQHIAQDADVTLYIKEGGFAYLRPG
ncbi:MAG: cupin domain-containing protein [Pseudomonadota bacterium]